MQVESGEHEKEIFYTALYHTMIQPNVMSDANGEYMAADYSVRRLPVGQVHYSTFFFVGYFPCRPSALYDVGTGTLHGFCEQHDTPI